jgi:hypothetical protein
MDFRRAKGLIGANQCAVPALYSKPKGSNSFASAGLTYERRVLRELNFYVLRGYFTEVRKNPWFEFTDTEGSALCSPDGIIFYNDRLIVVEIKLNWTPVAAAKLTELYIPVVTRAFTPEQPVIGLVICRNMVPGAPKPKTPLSKALTVSNSVLNWPSNGHIPW